LVGTDPQTWEGRRHFFAAAAEAMRRILIDRARRKRRLKHGGKWERVNVTDIELPAVVPRVGIPKSSRGRRLDRDGECFRNRREPDRRYLHG
jgi:hypothetical protein